MITSECCLWLKNLRYRPPSLKIPPINGAPFSHARAVFKSIGEGRVASSDSPGWLCRIQYTSIPSARSWCCKRSTDVGFGATWVRLAIPSTGKSSVRTINGSPNSPESLHPVTKQSFSGGCNQIAASWIRREGNMKRCTFYVPLCAIRTLKAFKRTLWIAAMPEFTSFGWARSLKPTKNQSSFRAWKQPANSVSRMS
jgi:hypothetical protein